MQLLPRGRFRGATFIVSEAVYICTAIFTCSPQQLVMATRRTPNSANDYGFLTMLIDQTSVLLLVIILLDIRETEHFPILTHITVLCHPAIHNSSPIP